MTAAAGLALAVVCIAIVAVGFALALTAWQPRARYAAQLAMCAAGLLVGGACLALAALHSAETALSFLP